jgi:hypothetical protein
MNRASFAFLIAACGGTQASVTVAPLPAASGPTPQAVVRPEPLPAGACGFDGILSGCKGNARWAVVAEIARDDLAATTALRHARAAKVADGYPFAIHTDQLPPADFREGIAIVLGLFEKERDARDEASALQATVVELATWEKYRERAPDFGDHRAVIEMLEDAPAFYGRDVRALEKTLTGPLKDDVARRAAFVKERASECRVHRGDVFVTKEREVAELSYAWAPVQCDDRREAFVLERATRFKAVVTHDRPPTISQVVQVQCAPTIETRPFGTPAGALGETHMDDDCD